MQNREMNSEKTCDMSVAIGALTLANPILTASGTFGYGEEVAPYCDLERLGAIICKTVTTKPRAGNAPPRVCETPSGMLNAIGLQNVGVKRFLAEKLPYLRNLGTPIIVNIAGETTEDFAELTAEVGAQPEVAAIELNISCPNVAHGLDYATDPALTEELVRRCAAATQLPLIAKLSPNVTDISVIAKAAEAGGASAVSVTNTFVGMAINARTRRPRISNITGGLSGPAIKPLALRAVYRCAGAVQIPVIGIGGIVSGEDAAEFLIAGASAVQVGTATFVHPDAPLKVLRELEAYAKQQGLATIRELVGSLHV